MKDTLAKLPRFCVRLLLAFLLLFVAGPAVTYAQNNAPGVVNRTEGKDRKAQRLKKAKDRKVRGKKRKTVKKFNRQSNLKHLNRSNRSNEVAAGTAPPSASPGSVKTVFPNLATQYQKQANERASKRGSAIRAEKAQPPGSVITLYSDRKGTKQPTSKAQEVWLAPELFPPGSVDIFHVNRPLKFDRMRLRADKKHQQKMAKVYPSLRVDYQTQKDQQKSAQHYARALWKNYHDNPDFNQVWLSPTQQMKAEEAYVKALWKSYGKKPSEYETMQKDADKRRKRLEKAFKKPIEHKVPERAKSTLAAAAGFDGYIVVDPNKERKISYQAIKFRNEFYLPLKVQFYRRSSSFEIKGARKHYAPYQPMEFGLFITPDRNPQMRLNPNYLKKRKRRHKYDKGEAQIWRKLQDSSRGTAEDGASGSAADEVEYQYNPSLELQNDPEPAEEEQPAPEEGGETEEDDGGGK